MGANATTSVPAYVSGEVLTAADLNITNSGIPVFAGTAERDAAFGGTGEKTLAEGQFAYIEASNTTQYYDGANWQPVSVASTKAIFREEQADTTYGGASTGGSYVKRVLNTTVVNDIVGCSIASSVITLPAGTYSVTAFAPVFGAVGVCRSRLRNTTDSTTIANGTNAQTSSASSNTVVQYYFTLAAQKNIELQTRTASTVATDGFGNRCSMGDTEVYSTIEITKVA